MIFNRHTILVMIKMGKVTIYSVLAVFLYANFIEAEGIANLLKIENPNQNGMDKINLEIPKYVIKFTFFAVILEIMSNILEVPDNTRNIHDKKRFPY